MSAGVSEMSRRWVMVWVYRYHWVGGGRSDQISTRMVVIERKGKRG